MGNDLIRDALTFREKKRAGKIKDSDSRQRFMISRGLLRILVSKYLGAGIADIDIGIAKKGKPYLAVAGNDLEFNLSHSGDLILMGFARGMEIGIDVEKHRPDIDHKKLSAFFSGEEREMILKKDDHRAFFDLWTAKEAFVKCSGEGLSYGLNKFVIRNNRIYTGMKCEKDAEVIPVSIKDGYSAALVVKRRMNENDNQRSRVLSS